MHTILAEIVTDKKKCIEQQKKAVPLEQLKALLPTLARRRRFLDAVAGGDRAHVIAEIKQASPSAGVIAANFDPVRIAKEYTEAGAAALSVLTEENHFHGSLEYLKAVRANTVLPILRKDFIVDPYQVYESKVSGADALLLIAAILDRTAMQGLAALASSLGLDCIAEVHSKEELQTVLSMPFEIIGINNRNLNDFSVSLNTARELVSIIPSGRTIIAESGIKTSKDIATLRKMGIHAFLVGETLMRSADKKKTMKGFIDA